jgi:hypothetical protein
MPRSDNCITQPLCRARDAGGQVRMAQG